MVEGLGLRVKLGNMRLCAVESGNVAMSSSAVRGARIGEVPQAEGFLGICFAFLSFVAVRSNVLLCRAERG